MLSLKENVIETLKHGKPDAFVNEWEPFPQDVYKRQEWSGLDAGVAVEDRSVIVYLGNNGRLGVEVPGTLSVTKTAEVADGFDGPKDINGSTLDSVDFSFSVEFKDAAGAPPVSYTHLCPENCLKPRPPGELDGRAHADTGDRKPGWRGAVSGGGVPLRLRQDKPCHAHSSGAVQEKGI